MLDLKKIKENYANFADSKLEYLAKYEVASLAPEVISILIDEIKKRGLSDALLTAIEAQITPLTEETLTSLKSKVISLPCPQCGTAHRPLMGTLVREVKSYIFFTSYKKKPIITCQTCADRVIERSWRNTLLFGWWGIPWGIFRTSMAIMSSLKDARNRDEQSDAILIGFTTKHIGEIKANSEKEQELIGFIRDWNNL